ncbi:MAG: hypothetical protein IID28_05115 [Planctomycetes bacterium]|nr:hypothetical protein [Planctomycetota bacterium]
MTHDRKARDRTGSILVVFVVVLIVVELIIVSMVTSLSRDHSATIHRAFTVEAFYAAEAGVNMAIRELMEDSDEDGDGTIGSVSDDTNDANDPTLGNARFLVTSTPDTPLPGQRTLTSQGRSGETRREMTSVIE